MWALMNLWPKKKQMTRLIDFINNNVELGLEMNPIDEASLGLIPGSSNSNSNNQLTFSAGEGVGFE